MCWSVCLLFIYIYIYIYIVCVCGKRCLLFPQCHLLLSFSFLTCFSRCFLLSPHLTLHLTPNPYSYAYRQVVQSSPSFPGFIELEAKSAEKGQSVPSEVMHDVNKWREFVASNPEKYSNRYHEDQLEEIRSRRIADPQIRFEKEAELNRFASQTLKEGLELPQDLEEPVSEVEPGPFPVELIQTLIKELTTQLGVALTKSLSEAIHEDLHDLLADDLGDNVVGSVIDGLKSSVTMSLQYTLPISLNAVITRAVPPIVNAVSAPMLTRTLTRALTHTLTPVIAMSMSRPADEEYVCSLCHYKKQYCQMCSWTTQKRAHMLYHADFLSDYFSDMFANHFTNREVAEGWPAAYQPE